MKIDELIIEYLNLRLEKIKSAKNSNFTLAAELRDKERELSKKIFYILRPDDVFLNYFHTHDLIDEFCVKNYNCSNFESSNCIKSIIRKVKLEGIIN